MGLKLRVAGALALGLLLQFAVPGARAIPFLNPRVTTEYDHAAQFGHRTYSWGDARMSVPRYVDIVKAIVDKNLKAKGWQLVASGGSATLFELGNTQDGPGLVDYYAANNGVWAQSWGVQGWGPGWMPGYGVAIYNALGTAENHLVIDIFDTTSHRLMFRGVTGEDMSNSDKKNTKGLEKSLKSMFKGMPKG